MSEINLKEIIRAEYTKCYSDPIHFLKKYCFIQHPKRGRLLFHLYPFQEKVIKLWDKHDYTIINKSRQLGISTLTAGYALWLMLFHEDKTVLCIATKQETAKNLVNKVKFMYDNLPSWLAVKAAENNRLSLRLTNGSSIKATTAATDSARSEAVSLLIIDEAAFIDGIEEVWASAQQTLATGGKSIVISTPYGTGNWFHRMYTQAEEGIHEKDLPSFLPIKLPWYVHPERDEQWRKNQDTLLGDPKIASQECFSEDVIIYTKEGPKFIKDIKYGDKVLSHDGTYNKVINTFSHIEENNLYEIKSGLNNIPKYVTGNHPFLNQDNEWVEVKNIDKTHIQIFPPNVKHNESNTIDLLNYIEVDNPKYFPLKYNDKFIWINKKSYINRYLKFDYDLGFLIGLYMAEGSTWKNVVAFNYNWDLENTTWPLELERIINDKFNINIFSHYRNKKDKGCNLYIKNQIFKKFIELCLSGGKYCYNKHISEFVYNNSNKETLKGIIDGIMMGDGLLKNEYNCSLGLTSPLLIYDVLYISNLIGIHNITIKKRDKTTSEILGKIYNVKPHKTLTFCNTKINSESKYFSKRINNEIINSNSKFLSKFIYEDNKALTTLKIKPASEKIRVYNFEVENTNTYVTEYGIVHNCDADFATSGDTVFIEDQLKWIEQSTLLEPIEKRGIDKNLWIWQPVDYTKEYLVIGDVARGDGKDFSGAQVIEIESNEQVAEFKGQLSPKEFGLFLVSLATEYNNALLVVESNNMGWSTIDTILERGYQNLYYSIKGDTTNSDTYFAKYEDINNLVPGFNTSMKLRPLVINKFREYISDRSTTIRSKRLLEEMRVFIWKNGRPEAQYGYNDDLLMSYAIGMYLRDTSLRFQQQNLDLTRKVLSSIKTSRAEHTGAYSSGNPYFRNPYEMVNPYSKDTNGIEDLKWLL